MTETHYYDTNEQLLKSGSAEEIQKAKEDGNFAISVPALREAKKKIEQELTSYKKAEAKIRADKNPAATEAVKEYELKRLREDLASKVNAVESEYVAAREQVITQARERSARATQSIDNASKEYAEQVYSRAAVEIMSSASAEGQRKALDKLAGVVEQMSDAEKLALMPKLIGLSIDEDARDSYRKVLRTLNRLASFDYHAADALEQLPLRPSTAYVNFQAARSKNRGTL